MRVLAAIFLLLSVAACDFAEADEGLSVEVSEASVLAGASVSGTVANRSDRPLYVYQCGGLVALGVQRSEGGAWETIGFVNNPCLDIYDQSPLALGEGQTQGFGLVLRSPGRFRVQATYGLEGDFDSFTETVVSEVFEVRAP